MQIVLSELRGKIPFQKKENDMPVTGPLYLSEGALGKVKFQANMGLRKAIFKMLVVNPGNVLPA